MAKVFFTFVQCLKYLCYVFSYSIVVLWRISSYLMFLVASSVFKIIVFAISLLFCIVNLFSIQTPT